MSMSEAQVAAFCLGLPGAREDYKWGGVRVFSIAGNKMFALQNLRGESLAFKVDKELFLGHVDRPGIHPGAVSGASAVGHHEHALPVGCRGTAWPVAALSPIGGEQAAQAHAGRAKAGGLMGRSLRA